MSRLKHNILQNSYLKRPVKSKLWNLMNFALSCNTHCSEPNKVSTVSRCDQVKAVSINRLQTLIKSNPMIIQLPNQKFKLPQVTCQPIISQASLASDPCPMGVPSITMSGNFPPDLAWRPCYSVHHLLCIYSERLTSNMILAGIISFTDSLSCQKRV